MNRIFFFAGLLFLTSSLLGQSPALITNIDSRQNISLDGQWKIIIDPYENGFYNYRHDEDPGGYFKNAKPQTTWDRIEYNFASSEELRVPGDWNTQKEKFFFYEGTVWYEKSFTYSVVPGMRSFLYFGAVNYQAIVYLNGEKLGEHIGGFTPFNFEITGKLKQGENFVVVKVDNKRLAEGVPTLNTDWWNYGGITRSVKLIETPATFIRDYSLQLEKNSANKISGWVQLDGEKLNQTIRIHIPGLGIDKVIPADKSGKANFAFEATIERWSPKYPKLYTATFSINGDTISDNIGFRTIETRGHEIYLNGEKIFLKGISIHEESPVTSSRANSFADAKQLLDMVQDLGCNFVRLAHYPHNEAMIREADKRGILVWAEIPVYWTIQWENERTYQNAANQLSELITRDKNRAAVILWSIGNETPRSEIRLSFMKRLSELARSVDNTRLITAATESHYINPKTIITDDPLGNYLDVLGCNEYIGWYDGLPAKADSVEWVSAYNKPLVISEFGADAKYNFHADSLTIWSEEFQENVYRHQLTMLKKIPTLQGMSPWILMDFRSPRRPLPGIQDYFNRKGLFSNLGEKKKAFFILKQFYSTDLVK